MSLDTDLAAKLHERLTEIETSSVSTLDRGLPFEKYQQACGFIEAIRQVRDTLLPETVIELQRK